LYPFKIIRDLEVTWRFLEGGIDLTSQQPELVEEHV